MAIALDATSEATPGTGTSKTWAHTCSGANRLLHVSVGARDGGGVNNECTGVTYNGVALTRVREDTSNFNTFRTSVWRLVAPASGSNNIVASFAGDVGIVAHGVGVSFTGVDQTTPDCGNNGSGDNSASTNRGASVTTTVDNAWIVDAMKKGAGGDPPPTLTGASGTIVSTTDSAGAFGVSYRGPITPSGATSVGWDWADGTSVNSVYSAAAYAPAAAAAGNPWNYYAQQQ